MNSIDSKPILVTGGAGYVGSVFVHELLTRGYSVRVLDTLAHKVPSLLGAWGHSSFEFLRGDIRDRECVARAVEGVSTVVHLAAIVGDPACERAPDLARQINVQATSSLLDAASAERVQRFVFVSTCSNYGKMSDSATYVTEDSELRPLSLYAETKVAGENDVVAHCSTAFTTCVLRLATVYGVSARMRFDLTINQFTRDLFLDRELIVYGEQYWRPYIHVRDAASALCTAISADASLIRGNSFNVGATSENYRKADLLPILKANFPNAVTTVVPTTGTDPRDYRVSFEKIRSVLGFEPSCTVSQGIAEVTAVLRSGLIRDPDDGRYGN